MRVLFVLTSHDQLGDTGEKTGFWVEEFAAPYYTLADAGVEVMLASPKGGHPPIDPKSELPDFQTEATKRYYSDDALQQKIAATAKLTDVKSSDFDAVFYPGGHGPLWDLTTDKSSVSLIENFYKEDKPVAAVCHASAVLMHAKTPEGEPIVKGKQVTGFSNTEEAAVALTKVVPFLLEDELKGLGGVYSKTEDWHPFVKKDGLLITGQNPASSEGVAKELLDLLK